MVDIDFLPERVKNQRARQRRMIRRGYLLVVTIGVLAGLGSAREGWIRQGRAEAFLLAEMRVNRETMRQRRMRLEAEWAGLLIQKRISDRLGSRAKPVDVVANIESVVRGADKNGCMVLRQLKVETMPSPSAALPPGGRGAPGGATPAPGPARVQVLVVGVAADDVTVANFVAQLSANRMFEDVNMEETKTVSFGGLSDAREFKVTCYVVR